MPHPNPLKIGRTNKKGEKRGQWGRICTDNSAIPMAQTGYRDQNKKDQEGAIIECGLGPPLILCDLRYLNTLSAKFFNSY